MKHKVEQLTEFLKETISGWSNVECITVDPRSEIFTYDPYFALVIDVYHKGKIPSPQRRRNAFGDPGDFESAAGRTKDRFFLEEIPIRIEYKDSREIGTLVNRPMQHINILKDSGTYPFYRLMNNHVVFNASGWIERTRKSLEDFPDRVWYALYDSFSTKMEHYLADMGGASFSDDRYFLIVSQAGFMRYAAAGIFMLNKRFEPSHRDIEEQLRSLGQMPDGFWTGWDSLLQKEHEITATKRFEIARILAKAVLSLHRT